jgi:hypothetical protein
LEAVHSLPDVVPKIVEFLWVRYWKKTSGALDQTNSPKLFSASKGAQMELRIAILCLVTILGNPALAQVSNQRDMYGNLVRDGGGASSQTGVNQSTPNSSGAIRNPPIPQSTNPTSSRAQQINRFGAGAN